MTIHHGDCLEVLKSLDAASVDACVCDPPYGIGIMGQEWDKVRTQWGGERGQFANQSRPTTYSDDKAYQGWCERWGVEVLRVLKPGAYIAAFGATRQYHRMACGIQDAGFDIRDSLAWMYGSGFPKSRNRGDLGTALKPAWEPIVLAQAPKDGTYDVCYDQYGTGYMNIDDARVPLHGEHWDPVDIIVPKNRNHKWNHKVNRNPGSHERGRWPPNVCHDGSDVVKDALGTATGAFYKQSYQNKPRAQNGGMLDGFQRTDIVHDNDYGPGPAARYFYCAKPHGRERMAGTEVLDNALLVVKLSFEHLGDRPCDTRGNDQPRTDLRVPCREVMGHLVSRGIGEFGGKDDCKWSIDSFGNGITGQCLMASASTTSTMTRSTIASKTLNWLTRSLTSASIPGVSFGVESGGNPAESAERFIPCRITTNGGTAYPRGAEDATLKMRLRISASVGPLERHPTQKPIELMRWLIRLVVPPGGTVLDPFLGSGTTAIAAHLEGRSIIGIEREAEYVRIAEARTEWWERNSVPGMTVEQVLGRVPTKAKVSEGQMDLLAC